MKNKIQIAPNGPIFSRIVFGTMKWGDWGWKLSTPEIERLIQESIQLGVTTFDHADIYGHYTTEADFGKALVNHSSLRQQIQLITKCGINLTTPNRPQYKIKSYDTSKAHILQSVENSLQNLSTDYIDLLLIHRPSPLLDPTEVAEAFTALKNAGKVLHFGVSNFTPTQFDALHNCFPLINNQVQASALHIDPFTDGTFDQCLKHRIATTVWSPLGGGSIFTTPSSQQANRVREVATQLADKYKAGLDQILLAWLLKHPAKLLPVLGTARMERVKAAVEALKIDLTSEEWFMILEASTGQEVA